MTVDEIFELTKIDRWFLSKLNRIHVIDQKLAECCLEDLGETKLRALKCVGFSDRRIGHRLKIQKSETEVRNHRVAMHVRPFVKQIDTLAAEYPASTNYLYLTYQGTEHDVQPLSAAECATPADSPRRSPHHPHHHSSMSSEDPTDPPHRSGSPTPKSPTSPSPAL